MINQDNPDITEKEIHPASGFVGILAVLLITAALIAIAVWGVTRLGPINGTALCVVAALALAVFHCFVYRGFVILAPNEAVALTFFGRYYGTVNKEGFYYVNPFTKRAKRPAMGAASARFSVDTEAEARRSIIPLKMITLNNDKQTVNDARGNPVVVGIAVTWRIADTAKALFAVDNFFEYLSVVSDYALRIIISAYPYDVAEEAEEKASLRASADEVSLRLKELIAEKMAIAGIEVIEARITSVSYAPGIAQAMLARQQATAVVAAKKLIVEGAVGMVEMALKRLDEKAVVAFDEEKKATMVADLLVVLCTSKESSSVVETQALS